MAEDPKDQQQQASAQQQAQQEPEGQQQQQEPQGQGDDVEAMKRALKKANKEAEAARLKVNERASTAEQRAEKAEGDLLRLRVAMEKGLSPKLAARLQGATEEELASDADDLLATVGGRRTPDFDGGGRQSTNTNSESFLTRAIRERR